MALYKYRKTENYLNSKREVLILERAENQRVNAWTGATSSYFALKKLANSSFLAHLLIPMFFVSIGVAFIYLHFLGDIQTYFRESTGITNQGNTSPVSDGFIDTSPYISNPSGLDKVAREAFDADILQEDVVSKNYQKTFYISIPSLSINRLPVTPNVNSTVPDIYNSVLTNSLAHFEGTGLPISDVKNNIVVYGHSASPTYGPSPSDPEVAFSFIPNLKVGDEIIIEMDGKEYKYRMFRSKIVEPSDVSIITGSKNQRTLTLFTCYPTGNNAQRYVAIARPVN